MQHGDMSTLPSITNNADIRYLGRVLGDVIRELGGERLFAATEEIRSASVERHRGTGIAVDHHLEALSLDETLDVVRGFMLFSMLANLAEDRQGITAEEGADVAAAVARLEREGSDRAAVLKLLDHALIAPVLGWSDDQVAREVEHYRKRVDAERESQKMPDDETADSARMGAPEVVPLR